MGYIAELRELIGSRPLLMAGATAAVFDAHGHLLLVLRTDNHCWSLPGGALEPGETLEATAARELLEETGIVAEQLTLFEVFSGPQLYYRYPNGDEVHNVTVVYLVDHWRGDLQTQPEENTALRFFPLDALPDRISPPDRRILTRLQEHAKDPKAAPGRTRPVRHEGGFGSSEPGER